MVVPHGSGEFLFESRYLTPFVLGVLPDRDVVRINRFKHERDFGLGVVEFGVAC